MTDNTKSGIVIMIVVVAITLGILIFATPYIVSALSFPLQPSVDPEHALYLEVRDYSECTKANDTVCINRGGCVHMYVQCQHDLCGYSGYPY